MPSKRKIKERWQVVEEQYYRLEIVGSELHYSFEAGNLFNEDEPVSEHTAIEVVRAMRDDLRTPSMRVAAASKWSARCGSREATIRESFRNRVAERVVRWFR